MRYPLPARAAGLALALTALLGCATHRADAQKAPAPTHLLNTTVLAGQQVAVIPITLVVPEPGLQGDSLYAPYRERRPGMLRADSLIGEMLTSRAPEVQWILAPQLRKAARRAPGFVPDPDQMGQAILRSPGFKELPDPLRSSLRNLSAVVGGRIVLVPAALGFVRPAVDSLAGLRADLTLVLADTRTGKILWRTVAAGRGTTPDAALEAAVAAALPGAIPSETSP